MSLILRAHIATAARDVVAAWPLDAFVAVNPMAGAESQPFGSGDTLGVAYTHPLPRYLSEYERGRISAGDLQAALLERVPALAYSATIKGSTMPAATVAAVDMQHPGPVGAAESTPTDPLDKYLSVWLGAFVAPDPSWPMPYRSEGFFSAWRALAPRDPALPQRAREFISTVADKPDAALAQAVAELAGDSESLPDFFRRELRALPGWVGHIKWRSEKVGDIDLVSYLAVRLTAMLALGLRPAPAAEPQSPSIAIEEFWARAHRVTSQLVGGEPDKKSVAIVARVLAAHPPIDHAVTWQLAYEIGYRSELVRSISSDGAAERRPELQVVMCIDPRSEGMRRHLEKSQNVETFGFAGFFGVPIRFARYGARGGVNALPALLTPRHSVTENPLNPLDAGRSISARHSLAAARRALHRADSVSASPFAYAELSGWLYGVASAIRTLSPSLHGWMSGLGGGALTLETNIDVTQAFTVDERAAMAETAIRMMGMSQFAPLVVLAGHGSHSTNNLYQSALDCGACGGNPGAANARAAAAMFNDPLVREALAARGLVIPEDTFFVSALHNTVADHLAILDTHTVPATHVAAVDAFTELQRRASSQLVAERAAALPGAARRSAVAHTRRRAHDWAEVYPELGLAGNAAIVIGPRDMTQGLNLERRVFLHSYRTELDPDGSALETIMTAPLIVAQWINHQYYFSALNPDALGAGTKTIHNAIGTVGVLSGHEGDLRRGLPWQSVGVGTELFHEPLRLSAIVQAPLERIGTIVSGNQVLRNLLDNEWITLTARENPTSPWYRYTALGWAPHVPSPEPQQHGGQQ